MGGRVTVFCDTVPARIGCFWENTRTNHKEQARHWSRRTITNRDSDQSGHALLVALDEFAHRLVSNSEKLGGDVL